MIEYMIPLLAPFLNSRLMDIYFYPVFGMAFVCALPGLFRYLMHRG